MPKWREYWLVRIAIAAVLCVLSPALRLLGLAVKDLGGRPAGPLPAADDDGGGRPPQDPLALEAKRVKGPHAPWRWAPVRYPNLGPKPELPRLSIALLQELFGELGVPYVPGDVIRSLDEVDAATVFLRFCAQFDRGGQPATRGFLAEAVLLLVAVDNVRRREPLSDRPVFEALRSHDLERAEQLVESMERIAGLLESMKPDGALLGKHRNMLCEVRHEIERDWVACIHSANEAFEIHLEWKALDERLAALDREASVLIEFVQPHLEKLDGDMRRAFENICEYRRQILDYLTVDAGDPSDTDWGLDAFEHRLVVALRYLVDSCGETVPSSATATPTLEDDLRMLELNPAEWNRIDASTVKRKYRLLCAAHHPDLARDEQDERERNERFKLIGQAYQRVYERLVRRDRYRDN